MNTQSILNQNIRSIYLTTQVLVHNKEQGKDYLETCELELHVDADGKVTVDSCEVKK